MNEQRAGNEWLAGSTRSGGASAARQRVLVFQQHGSGESKITGIRRFAGGMVELETVSIDEFLPSIIDDASEYLPDAMEADVVLDYLKHPDVSHDLAQMCVRKGIPVISSGKKLRVQGALTPPT